MAKLFDPQKAAEGLQEARGGQPSAAEVVGLRRQRKGSKAAQKVTKEDLKGSTSLSTEKDPLKRDFRVFLTLVWRFLKLPDPTPLQLSIAWWLQHCPHDRAVLMAFRGAAKSWITAAFALWTLHCDPQKKVLVVSASLSRATQFVQFCLALIQPETGIPELRHLAPQAHQRQSGQQFDVGPARPDQSPSLRAAGITGQITGSRADLIIPDDVEIPANSMTTLMREKIREAVKEFDSILKPGGSVRFLGTPQSDDSLYNHLKKRGYIVQIWPAQFPTRQQITGYGDALAGYIRHQLQRDPTLAGTSTEPSRFSLVDLEKRRLSLGRSTYDLQFMLDTSLSDAAKYPLKLRDLIVMGLDPQRGPDAVSWGNGETLVLQALPNLGFDGDRLHGPANLSETFSPYSRIVAAIDSSGRGTDETALAIGAELHGMVYVLYVAAWRAGYAEETLKGIAKALVRFNVHEALVESNFGDGMFMSLLKPVVEEEWKKANAKRHSLQQGGTELVEMRSGKTQKELRILSVVEPAMQQHRVVFNSEAIEADFKSVKAMEAEETRDRYSLIYQMTRLTRERDCLVHDDRVEALAIMLGAFAEELGVSPEGMALRTAEERQEEELEKLFEEADEVGGWAKGRGRGDRVRAGRPTVR